MKPKPLASTALAAALLTTFLSAGGWSAPAAALSIGFEPPAQSVALGDQASVDVMIGAPGGLLVGAYDFFVAFDSTILGLDTVASGPALGGPLDSFESAVTAPDAVNASALSFLFDFTGFQDGVSDFQLFTLVFDTLSAGTSALSLIGNIGGDANAYLSDDTGQIITPLTTGGGSITVTTAAPPPTAVAEPGTLILALFGLAAVFCLRHKYGARNVEVNHEI